MIEERILVTGGAGFIGSRLVERLVYANDVVVFDNFARDALSANVVSRHSRLSVLDGHVSMEFARRGGPISRRDRALCGDRGDRHCRAESGADHHGQHRRNRECTGMRCRARPLRPRGVFSTSEVFGQQAFRSAETDQASSPRRGSALDVRREQVRGGASAIAYHDELGLPTTVVRPFNVYGPGQVGEGALRTFVLRALAGETIQIHGDGTQIRAWCYVDDLIDGVLLAMRRPEAIGESFNVGNQRAVVTVYGLANTVVRVLDSVSEISSYLKARLTSS